MVGQTDRFEGITARIDGRIFQRGFWLYVWEISNGRRQVLYVGRTGDSSSHYASSPFARFGQHMDAKSHARGNAILKNLRKCGMDPSECTFDLFAVGPLFKEQREMQLHRERRHKVAALEFALASHLRKRGYEVIGTHACSVNPTPRLLRRLLTSLEERFPPRAGRP